MIRVRKEEGHYTLKIVEKLPARGNANWLYAIKDEPIKKGYVWTLDNEYKTIYIGGSEEAGGFTVIEAGNNIVITGTGIESDPYIVSSTDPFAPTSLLVDYGITLAPVAISNNYNDLDNLPSVVNNYVSNVILNGTNLEITGIGLGFDGIVDLSSISSAFPGFTDLPTDYGVTLSTVATTNNYNDLDNLPTIPSAPTGLEAINEGNGIGWRLIGRDPTDTVNIGFGAIDFSDNTLYPNTGDFGPGSEYSINFGGGNKLPAAGGNFGAHLAIGSDNIVGGYYNNMAFGVYNNMIQGYSAVAMGFANTVNLTSTVGQGFALGTRNNLTSYWTSAIGTGLITKSVGTVAVGISNIDYAESGTAADRPMFIVGNGTASTSTNPAVYGSRLTASDAFRVRYNGVVEAPSYGSGTITGTATRSLAVDANGKIIEEPLPGAAILPYTTYVATLTQSGTGDPVPTILENTTGATVAWTRDAAGDFTATFSSPVLTLNKVSVQVTKGVEPVGFVRSFWNSTTIIKLQNYNTSGTATDTLTRASFEVRIYS